MNELYMGNGIWAEIPRLDIRNLGIIIKKRGGFRQIGGKNNSDNWVDRGENELGRRFFLKIHY